jgi:hypothetical protein
MVAWITATLADDPCRMRSGKLRCSHFLEIARLPGWEKSPASQLLLPATTDSKRAPIRCGVHSSAKR